MSCRRHGTRTKRSTHFHAGVQERGHAVALVRLAQLFERRVGGCALRLSVAQRHEQLTAQAADGNAAVFRVLRPAQIHDRAVQPLGRASLRTAAQTRTVRQGRADSLRPDVQHAPASAAAGCLHSRCAGSCVAGRGAGGQVRRPACQRRQAPQRRRRSAQEWQSGGSSAERTGRQRRSDRGAQPTPRVARHVKLAHDGGRLLGVAVQAGRDVAPE